MFNKKRTLVFVVATLLICLFVLTGCKKTYVVTFNVNGKAYHEAEVKKNKVVEAISYQANDKYYFDGWYLDGSEYDFSTKVTENITLDAKLTLKCDRDGHKYIDATCTNAKKCTVCDLTEGQPLEHNIVVDAKVEATCDKEGLTEGSHCSLCDTVIVAQEIIEKKEHTWIDATYDAPKTCTSCGATEGEAKPKPASVEVESTRVSIYIGEAYDFNPTILPANANQEVKYTFKTAEGAVATISEDGILTATHEGFVYVTISSKELSYIGKTVTVEVLHPLIENGGYDAYNIMTGYGSDASSEVEINYHTHNIYTSVEYTLASDPNFTNVTDAVGTGYYFTNGIDKVDVVFPGRNIYRVSLKGLLPDTEYIYRINKGNDTYTETYSFKTSKNDGSDSAFLVFADIHYHAQTAEDGTFKSHGSEINEEVITKIINNNPELDINMMATLGDIVDTGGNANTWSVFFEHSKSLKSLVRLGMAGNHEYYIGGTGQSDGRYQKAHYATVNNGPSTQLGLSSYVLYNGVLIILIDNEDASGRLELMEWLDDILENLDYKYSIAMMHSPIYYETWETTNNDRDEKMMDIFDKHSVDLVMAGHYHGHRVRANYYDGQTSTDPGLGVNYMNAASGGIKGGEPKGYIVETSNGVIKLKYFDKEGNLISTDTFACKRDKEFEIETKENLLNSITGAYNEETNEYVISMSNKFYGNVKKLEVEELLRGEIKDDMVFPTASYNKYIVKNLKKNYQYNFKITVHFVDGTSEVVYQTLDLATNINLVVTNTTTSSITLGFGASHDDMLYMIKDYVVYVNGVEYGTFNYLDYYDEPVLSYVLTGLESNKTYEIKLVAREYNNKKIYEYSVEATTK